MDIKPPDNLKLNQFRSAPQSGMTRNVLAYSHPLSVLISGVLVSTYYLLRCLSHLALYSHCNASTYFLCIIFPLSPRGEWGHQ